MIKRVERVLHRRRRGIECGLYALAGAMVALSAVIAKEASTEGSKPPALARVERTDTSASRAHPVAFTRPSASPIEPLPEPKTSAEPSRAIVAPEPAPIHRWFDARPVREARIVWMTVTAYSPDERSCGEFADGQTATLHSVRTNGMQLVAADTDVLPYGAMLTVPGYAGDSIVPVLDCGGAIKGHRLDVLMATHEEALEWGVRRVPVTVWEYTDGEPAPNPREVR